MVTAVHRSSRYSLVIIILSSITSIVLFKCRRPGKVVSYTEAVISSAQLFNFQDYFMFNIRFTLLLMNIHTVVTSQDACRNNNNNNDKMIIQTFVCRGNVQYPREYCVYIYVRDYCYIGNAMTPIVCFWAKIIKGEPSSGSAAAVECCAARETARAGKNICSGLVEKGEKKRSNINRNKNYTRPVVAADAVTGSIR